VGISLPLGQDLGIASALKPSVTSYPNPVDDVLFVNTSNSNTTDAVFVYDMLGNMLLQDSQSANGFFAIDVSSLSRGLYLVKLYQKGVVVKTIKCIKN
jgi:hypothetical protein